MPRIPFLLPVLLASLGSPGPAGARSSVERRALRSVAFSPDGRHLAVGGDEATWVLDAKTRRVRLRPGEIRGRQSVSFLPDGRLVTQGWSDTRSALWDPVSGRRLEIVPGAVACGNLGPMAWGCRSVTEGWRVSFEPWGPPRRISVEPWNGKTLGKALRFEDPGSLYRPILAASRDATVAVAGHHGYSAVETDRAVMHREAVTVGGQRGHASFLAAVPRLVPGGFLRLYRRHGHRVCERLRLGAAVTSATLAPSGGRVLLGHADGRVTLLSGTCTLLRTLSGHRASVSGVALHPHGTAAASVDEAGQLVWWDLGSGKPVATRVF